MIKATIDNPVYLIKGILLKNEEEMASPVTINKELEQHQLPPLKSNIVNRENDRKSTMAYKIMSAHNSGTDESFKITFDAIASHDITYVNIIQTAISCGLKNFPVPYILTNCHNSLCAVGGTINEDDHLFGLTAAKKFGGIYVPPHLAVIHQFMRETACVPGNMILGSDSHTRYGALGVMGIGEGGPELVKQLLQDTYNIRRPDVVAVYLEGKPAHGVGPQDVALAIIGKVFKSKYVKNKVLEFVGPGIQHLTVDFRNGIDVMTTETTCLSSIWQTDNAVKKYYENHGIGDLFKVLNPGEVACYDGLIRVNLDKIEPMVAVPFHPSNVYTISELTKNISTIAGEIDEYNKDLVKGLNISFSLKDKIKNGRLSIEQGVIAGCAGGTYENIALAAKILKQNKRQLNDFSLYVYPASQPVNMGIIRNGIAEDLISSGGIIRSSFCGPCFGACDVPSHQGLSVRHTTRNFPNREGSIPSESQISAVFLMDARSIAATALNNGILTSAFDIDYKDDIPEYIFDKTVYERKIFNGFGKQENSVQLHFGPNIKPWPVKPEMPEHLLLVTASSLLDPVTTTDELIPSGQTSSYRSNPEKLSTFCLSKRDPKFLERIRIIQKKEEERKAYVNKDVKTIKNVMEFLERLTNNKIFNSADTESVARELIIGGVVYATKPGDGSAREQAASCQKILDVWANIARDYATKRYRSNLINWGILPFILPDTYSHINVDEYIFIPHIKQSLMQKKESIDAYLFCVNGEMLKIRLELPHISDHERTILLAGNVINYYRNKHIKN